MREFRAIGESLPKAYHNALHLLNMAKDLNGIVPCPDWNCVQLECSITMVVENPLEEPRISRLIPCGPKELQKYVLEILWGIMDFEIERGNWSYTYHDRFAGQIEDVIEELKRNRYTRRACMTIRLPEDIQSNDPPCLQHIQFFVRENKLDMYVLFRSNDAVKATYMNAFALIELQKVVAGAIGVDVGSYVHRANSFHCYEKDFGLLEQYDKRIVSGSGLTYRYDEEWQDDMESSIPDIMREVAMLRRENG